jgi:hypothetical protein
VAHTKIASQTSFKGLFFCKKWVQNCMFLRFCMSKPNFFAKKAHYDRFSFFFFANMSLLYYLFICSTKVSVFKVFWGRFIYSFVCLFAYLCYITLIHLQMT